MTTTPCPESHELLAATRRGALDEHLRSHLANCADCALALEVEQAMRASSETLAAVARERLAPAEVVLLRARLRARRESAERSLRPMEIWQRFAVAAAAVGLAVGVLLSGSLFTTLGRLGSASGSTAADPRQAALVAGVAALLALPFVQRTRPTA